MKIHHDKVDFHGKNRRYARNQLPVVRKNGSLNWVES